MFLPTGDTPNPRGFTPWVNYTLIAANVAVYVFISLPLSAQEVDPYDPLVREYLRVMQDQLPGGLYVGQVLRMLSQYDLYVFVHGYKPGAPELSDLLYSMFLHGGLLHLFGNMLFLWIYGDNVEHRLGRIGYLMTYLGTGVAATQCFAVFAGDALIPMVGASGAISGVLGLYFVLFPRNQVKVLIFLFPIFYDVFLLPARIVLGIYLIIDNLLPFVVGAQSGVAYGAHIGGFLAGMGVAWAGERLSWQWPWGGQFTRAPAGETAAEPPDVKPAHLRRAIREGDAATALSLAGRVEPQQFALLGPKDCVTLAGWMEEAGYPTAAGRLLRHCLSRHRRSDELAEVYLQLGLLRLRQGQETSAYQYLLDALDQARDPTTAAQAQAALAEINYYRR